MASSRFRRLSREERASARIAEAKRISDIRQYEAAKAEQKREEMEQEAAQKAAMSEYEKAKAEQESDVRAYESAKSLYESGRYFSPKVVGGRAGYWLGQFYRQERVDPPMVTTEYNIWKDPNILVATPPQQQETKVIRRVEFKPAVKIVSTGLGGLPTYKDIKLDIAEKAGGVAESIGKGLETGWAAPIERFTGASVYKEERELRVEKVGEKYAPLIARGAEDVVKTAEMQFEAEAGIKAAEWGITIDTSGEKPLPKYVTEQMSDKPKETTKTREFKRWVEKRGKEIQLETQMKVEKIYEAGVAKYGDIMQKEAFFAYHKKDPDTTERLSQAFEEYKLQLPVGAAMFIPSLAILPFKAVQYMAKPSEIGKDVGKMYESFKLQPAITAGRVTGSVIAAGITSGLIKSLVVKHHKVKAIRFKEEAKFVSSTKIKRTITKKGDRIIVDAKLPPSKVQPLVPKKKINIYTRPVQMKILGKEVFGKQLRIEKGITYEKAPFKIGVEGKWKRIYGAEGEKGVGFGTLIKRGQKFPRYTALTADTIKGGKITGRIIYGEKIGIKGEVAKGDVFLEYYKPKVVPKDAALYADLLKFKKGKLDVGGAYLNKLVKQQRIRLKMQKGFEKIDIIPKGTKQPIGYWDLTKHKLILKPQAKTTIFEGTKPYVKGGTIEIKSGGIDLPKWYHKTALKKTTSIEAITRIKGEPPSITKAVLQRQRVNLYYKPIKKDAAISIYKADEAGIPIPIMQKETLKMLSYSQKYIKQRVSPVPSVSKKTPWSKSFPEADLMKTKITPYIKEMRLKMQNIYYKARELAVHKAPVAKVKITDISTTKEFEGGFSAVPAMKEAVFEYYSAVTPGLRAGIDTSRIVLPTTAGITSFREITIPKTDVSLKEISISRVGITPRTAVSPREATITRTAVSPRTALLTREAVTPIEAVMPKTAVSPREALLPKMGIPSIPVIATPTTPIPTPTIVIPPVYDFGKQKKRESKAKKKPKKKGYKIKSIYKPSIAGIYAGKIETKIPKRLTGLEIRGVLREEKKKRRRKKKMKLPTGFK